MDFLYHIGTFLIEAIIIVAAIGAIALIVMAAGMKNRHKSGGLNIDDLSEQYSQMSDQLSETMMGKSERKAHHKAVKAEHKKNKKHPKQDQHKLFVVDFKGSIDAKEVRSLREEVSAILSVAKTTDEVLIRLESGGGMVHGYGLAASQLARIRSAGIPLTIAVDKVAASGGYMMACIGNKILAAPFAIVGSIGVVAQLPNFNKLLKKNDIDYEQITAGKYKRTLTMFGENTDDGREKFKEELEQTHQLFKGFVHQYRPELDVETVATGEHWFGKQAIEKGLIDEITTSDDYLMRHYKERQVVKVHYQIKKKISDRLGKSVAMGVENAVGRFINQGKWDWMR
ncbi:protease SohB [Celerinatantimonas sp. MCCC 1A17872]|uniref:protease SohB n=1 Tax=Celerinatantimonas sp. MCCC 1A17872 TaxID=3177514 RepID=UPI0038C916C5